MLDFYLIADSKRNLELHKLEKLDYAGGMESDVFERLVRKKIIDSRFKFDSDFRWSHAFMEQIESKIKEFDVDSDIRILKRILEKAIKAKSGLIAYGD